MKITAEKKEYTEIHTKRLCIGTFVFILVAQLFINRLQGMNKLPFRVDGLNGMIAQIQVLISIILVVNIEKKGFKIARTLCIINSVFLFVTGVLLARSMSAIPGVVSPLLTIGICYLIHSYSMRAIEAQEELQRINENLIETNETLAQEGERLTQLHYYDQLTGLANGEMFNKQIGELMEESEDPRFTVIFMNIDDFTAFNDKHDSKIGDVILTTLGYRLHSFCGTDAIVARTGGDEFAVVVKGQRTREAIGSYISDLKCELCEPVSVMGKLLEITMCFGAAMYPKNGENAAEVISNARVAVNTAKYTGKNMTVFYDELD